MATVQASLAWALNRMARGSQDCADTVKEVTCVMMPMLSALVVDGTPEPVAAVQPYLQDLVHAAGWLHQCIRPSSSLLPHLQAAALQTWLGCMFWINHILFHHKPCDMADFLLLLEPRSRPQVPGVLVWVDHLAAQLASQVARPADHVRVVTNLLRLWQHLAWLWAVRATTPASASGVLQPGILVLIQQVIRQPPSTAAAARSCFEVGLVDACLHNISQVAGAPLELLRLEGQERCAVPATTSSSSSSSSSDGGRGRGCGLFGDADQAHIKQVEAVVGSEELWWGGVAALSSCVRDLLAPAGAGHTGPAATYHNGMFTYEDTVHHIRSSNGSSRGNTAAALCPRYYRTSQWLADKGGTPDNALLGFGVHSLELLLQQEAAGSLAWTLQQLQPYMAAQQARQPGSSVATGVNKRFPCIQWPMLYGSLNGSTSVSTAASSGCRPCQCGAPTCHLCTPPPPVTLQQLRLVLEVVCLTCKGYAAPALQAPALLALLLQRAAPGVRAAFLNSADGTRLLVALQQMVNAEPPTPALSSNWWTMDNQDGAVTAVDGVSTGRTWGIMPGARAGYTLAWSFLEVDHPAAASAAAGAAAEWPPPPAQSKAGAQAAAASHAAEVPGAPAGRLVAPAAVAGGAVLTVPGWYWAAQIHLLQVPSTSLRLAAGVQPSLALFATLEGLMADCHTDQLLMLLTAFVAAVRALLDPSAAAACSFGQQQLPGDRAYDVDRGTTTSPQGDGNRSSSPQAAGASCSTMAAPATTRSNNESSSHADSSSSSSSSSAAGPAPGVLEAISSTALHVGKIALEVGATLQVPPPLPPEEQQMQREMLILCARLCDAVLQLALQQLQLFQHSPGQDTQQSVGSRAVMQLLQSGERLLRGAAAAGMIDVRQRPGCSTGAFLHDPPASHQVGAAPPRMRAMCDKSQQWVETLHTALLRFKALKQAAAQARVGTAEPQRHTTAAETPVSHPEQPGGPRVGQAPAASEPTAARTDKASASAAAAPQAAASAAGGGLDQAVTDVDAGESPGCGVDMPFPTGTLPWCPTHSSSPAPLHLEVTEHSLFQLIEEVFASIVTDQRLPLMGCGYGGCLLDVGPSEAGLVNRRQVVCSGCGVVRFCCRSHAAMAWPAHYSECRRLAAALGRKPASGSSSSGGNSNRSTQVKGSGPVAAQARGFFGPRPGVMKEDTASGIGGSSSTTNSNSSGAPNDAICVRDQGPPPCGRVCSWCGVASQQLLRCGRCKGVWYCGVDHQRAAWKAGHRQECGGGRGGSGGAAAAAAAPSAASAVTPPQS